VIAFDRVKRCDVTHRPELTVSGERYVEQIVAIWDEGQIWPIWVYPSGDCFIASDVRPQWPSATRAEKSFKGAKQPRLSAILGPRLEP
jgi:hypothetical protein